MVGRYAHLDGVLVREEVDDLERVRDNADGQELLAVVAAVHHERVGETLDDRALGLAEALDSISAGGVRNVDRLSDLDVIAVKVVSPCLASLFQAGAFAKAMQPACGTQNTWEPYVREMSRISTSS